VSESVSKGSSDGRVPQVVFVCRANGGRSVASRLLTEHYARGRVVAVSGGTEPGEHIHPEVAKVLEDLGLDTSRETPELITVETVAASDVAITMGCGDNCPWSPTTRMVDWPLDDPKGQDDATVRRIIADIDTRVRALLVELVPGIELPPSVVTAA
jgi:arsenate reductase